MKKVRGVALVEGKSKNGVLYLPEEMELAGETFTDVPILMDHVNSVEKLVGRTTKSQFEYRDGKAVITFEGFVDHDWIEDRLEKGILKSVSIGAHVDKLIRDRASNSVIAKGIKGAEISFVGVPGVKGASVEMAYEPSFEEVSYAMKVLKDLEEKKLSYKEREALPDSDFCIVKVVNGKKIRKYPIPDINHARNALARVAQHGTPEEKKIVRQKVYARYPSLKKEEESDKGDNMTDENVKVDVKEEVGSPVGQPTGAEETPEEQKTEEPVEQQEEPVAEEPKEETKEEPKEEPQESTEKSDAVIKELLNKIEQLEKKIEEMKPKTQEMGKGKVLNESTKKPSIKKDGLGYYKDEIIF